MPGLHIDLIQLIEAAGYIGLFAIIFAETGLLIGFFLPGDSLLFTAGILASQGYFNIWLLIFLLTTAAVLGDNVSYGFGYRIGPRIFSKHDSMFFHQDHLRKTNVFFERYGRKTIIIARFMPIVRTFTPILAGVGKMHYGTFLIYNFIGGVLWAGGITILGYFLGRSIPGVDRYLLPIIAIIVLASILPTLIQVVRDKETKQASIERIKKMFWLLFISRKN